MWTAYFIPVLYIATVLASYGYNYFNLFLKALKNPDGTPTWTTSQVNSIPIAGGAINVVFGTYLAVALQCKELTSSYSLDLGNSVRHYPVKMDINHHTM